VPSRYEVEAFARNVDALRDDVARFEARLSRVETPDAKRPKEH
jgi:ubiquinone biosynthesis protein UbiJ